MPVLQRLDNDASSGVCAYDSTDSDVMARYHNRSIGPSIKGVQYRPSIIAEARDLTRLMPMAALLIRQTGPSGYRRVAKKYTI